MKNYKSSELSKDFLKSEKTYTNTLFSHLHSILFYPASSWKPNNVKKEGKNGRQDIIRERYQSFFYLQSTSSTLSIKGQLLHPFSRIVTKLIVINSCNIVYTKSEKINPLIATKTNLSKKRMDTDGNLCIHIRLLLTYHSSIMWLVFLDDHS